MLRMLTIAFALLVSAGPSLGQQSDVEEIVLTDNSPAKPLPSLTSLPKTVGPYGQREKMSLSGGQHLHVPIARYDRTLAHWKDVLTLPHSRMECVTWASGDWPWGGGWKTCVGWKTQLQWLWNTASLDITAGANVNLQEASNECLAEGTAAAAVAAIVTAYTTGGEATGGVAAGTFKTVLTACMVAKLAGAAINVSVPVTSQWGSWE